MRSWRKAVFEFGWVGEYLDDLAILLELKLEKVERNASFEADDTADDRDDDVNQPGSPVECVARRIPEVGDAASGQSYEGQDAVQVAAS